jgi:hypothetical protein
MARVALASIVSVLVACAGIRPGVSDSSGSVTSGQGEDGCNGRDADHFCAGADYDDIAVAIATVAVLGVLVPRFVRKLRD